MVNIEYCSLIRFYTKDSTTHDLSNGNRGLTPRLGSSAIAGVNNWTTPLFFMSTGVLVLGEAKVGVFPPFSPAVMLPLAIHLEPAMALITSPSH